MQSQRMQNITADMAAIIEYSEDTLDKLGVNDRDWANDTVSVPTVMREMLRNQATIAAHLAQLAEGRGEGAGRLR